MDSRAKLALNDSVIQFGAVTRAWGECFIQIIGLDEISDYDCRCLGLNGNEFPAKIIRLDANEGVVVLPVTKIKLMVSILKRSEDGGFVEIGWKRVSPLRASLESKFNRIIKNPTAASIRCNVELRDDKNLSVTHIIRDESMDVVRGTLRISHLLESAALSDEMEFIVLDKDTGEILSPEWVCLGDRLDERPGYPGVVSRTIDFSMRVPEEKQEFVVWARWKSDKSTIAFLVLYEEWVSRLKADWINRIKPIDQDQQYESWFLNEHSTQRDLLNCQKEIQDDFRLHPLFSVVVPLFETPIAYFDEMIDSVLAQTYDKFELILINASPANVELGQRIDAYCSRDSRVRCISLERNYGITENTNYGIKASRGEFVVFLDHDDTIEPDALFWYAKAINDYPQTDLIYCDEDHLLNGHYVLPFLKPDWDIDLLCCENYVCHMLSVRRETVIALGPLPTKEFDGSQDHNMTFLVGEVARNVFHVRKILYHWRMHEGSVAGAGIEQKAYALEAERLAVQNHCIREGIDAEAVMGARVPARCDLQYHFDNYPLVSIIIPNRNSFEVLKRCIDSIISKTSWPNYEIIIVENGSSERDVLAYYDELKSNINSVRVVSVEQPDGFNYSELINAGVRDSLGDFLLLLNNDTEVISEDWIELMMGPAMRDGVGCVGAKLLYPDGLIQHVGVAVGRCLSGPFHIDMMLPNSTMGYYETCVLPHQMSAVTAACMLTSKKAYVKVGGLDESFPVEYNDIDYCLRLRMAGYEVIEQTNALLYHYESVSRGFERSKSQAIEFTKAQGRYFERWGRHLVYGDPFYSQNFKSDNEYHKLDMN